MADLKSWLLAIVFGIILIFLPGLIWAADVTLQWNPVEEATGYKVYHGQASGDYLMPSDAGMETTRTLVDIADGHWYFAVTAYNDYGESGYSEEVDATIVTGTVPPLPDGVSVVITYTYDNGLVVNVEIN